MSIGYETPRGGADAVDSYIRIRAVLRHTILSRDHFFISQTTGRRLSLVKNEAGISKNPECIGLTVIRPAKYCQEEKANIVSS